MTGPDTPPPSRWAQQASTVSGAEYAAHFDALAAKGTDPHGEASLCARLAAPGSRILDAGCGTGRVAVRLAELGYRCVGLDSDEVMLAHARTLSTEVDWVLADLSESVDLAAPFDLAVAAGNVIPLVAPGTEPAVLHALWGYLASGGLLVAGFGLDAAHLPLQAAPFGLAEYDEWCAATGLVLEHRWSTWDGMPWDGGGYAVSIHRRA
ncbi:MAG TPA: class I SAM-dependent methyltransferase [Mycobacteriales bacterium]|jgi:SAM-dependent methyltransferase|nr:class I SAM-dependent methyltransferase [Mycobacteriales bacterium]